MVLLEAHTCTSPLLGFVAGNVPGNPLPFNTPLSFEADGGPHPAAYAAWLGIHACAGSW